MADAHSIGLTPTDLRNANIAFFAAASRRLGSPAIAPRPAAQGPQAAAAAALPAQRHSPSRSHAPSRSSDACPQPSHVEHPRQCSARGRTKPARADPVGLQVHVKEAARSKHCAARGRPDRPRAVRGRGRRELNRSTPPETPWWRRLSPDSHPKGVRRQLAQRSRGVSREGFFFPVNAARLVPRGAWRESRNLQARAKPVVIPKSIR